MNRIAVQSSNLHSVGYHEDSQTLEIKFNHGGVYQYFDVPPSVYEELMSADSHGSYFNAVIKGVFSYQKVR